MPVWYEKTPTVWQTGDGHQVYINPTAAQITELNKNADKKKWVDRAKANDSHITIGTREAVQNLLKPVPPAEITKAGMAAAVLDVAPPATGTAQAKLEAVRVKLSTAVSPNEYDKAAALYRQYAPTPEITP